MNAALQLPSEHLTYKNLLFLVLVANLSWTYLKGLIPLCVSMWIFKFDLFWNNFPHRLQAQEPFTCLLWTSFMCRCKAARDPRSFKQLLHWNSFSTSDKSEKTCDFKIKNNYYSVTDLPLCILLMCTFNFWGWQNFLPQKSHKGRDLCGFAEQPYVRCISK